jgi:hypothetical protein
LTVSVRRSFFSLVIFFLLINSIDPKEKTRPPYLKFQLDLVPVLQTGLAVLKPAAPTAPLASAWVEKTFEPG